MNRRTALFLSAISVALLPANAFAQQSDVDGVKAASQAYYAALAVADNGAAMEKVWAHTPYITYVGPRSKSIIVGWEPLKKMWEELNNITAERKVAVSDAHVHVNGNLAWEMAQETGSAKFRDGKEVKIDSLVTNVYEKLDGRWLIVSHHVQPKPQ